MKKIVTALLMVLLTGTISNVSYASNLDTKTELENKIQRELEKKSDQNVSFEDVEIDFQKEKIKIEAEVQEDTEIRSVQIVSEFSEEQKSNSDSLVVKEILEDEKTEYSIYFGTIEQKQQLDDAMEEEELLLKDIEKGVFTEEELKNIELPTEKIYNNEKYHINSVEELKNVPIVITNLVTNEEKEIHPSDGVASAAWAIPVGIYITQHVASQLLLIGFAVIVGGLIGFALTIISVNPRYRKYYDHYRVVRAGKVGLTVLNGMNLNTATNYMKAGGDVWSTSQPLAWKIAYYAGKPKGGRLQQPTKVERHGSGNFWHYHTWNRAGGHSFYGTASK